MTATPITPGDKFYADIEGQWELRRRWYGNFEGALAGGVKTVNERIGLLAVLLHNSLAASSPPWGCDLKCNPNGDPRALIFTDSEANSRHVFPLTRSGRSVSIRPGPGGLRRAIFDRPGSTANLARLFAEAAAYALVPAQKNVCRRYV